jgi:hypothetical protein
MSTPFKTKLPNVPLWIFIIAVVLRRVIANGPVARPIIRGTGLVALVWWALDETFRGVNPWRRLVGLGCCVLMVSRMVASRRPPAMGVRAA